MRKLLLLNVSILGLAGCSGLDNPCNSQGAGHCASVTTAYQNSLKDTVQPTDLPRGQSIDGSSSGGTSRHDDSSSNQNLVASYNLQHTFSLFPLAGDPLRSTPKTMRVWILPYEDDMHLYHDQQYVYAVIERGSWKYKSMSLSSDQNYYANTIPAGQVQNISYQPFGPAKESVPAVSNQNLISAIGSPSNGSNVTPFSSQAIAEKNTAAINSINTSGNN